MKELYILPKAFLLSYLQPTTYSIKTILLIGTGFPSPHHCLPHKRLFDSYCIWKNVCNERDTITENNTVA